MKKKFLVAAITATAATLALASCGDVELPTTGTPTAQPSGETPTTVTPATETTTGGEETTTVLPDLEEGTHVAHTLDLTAALNTSSFKTPAEDRTIVFHHTMGDTLQKALQEAIDAFEADFPGWKISSTQIGGYDDVRSSCIAGLSAGNQPDLAYCYPDHVAMYLKTGKVVNMADYINATGTINGKAIGYTAEEVADFVPGYYNEGKASNFGNYDKYGYKATDMLTLPYVKSTEVLYYNKDALTAAGITKVPETWDELWDQCAILGEFYPECTPLGYDSEANWVINMCEQNGWGYTSASTPHYLFDNTELANWLDDLYGKYQNDFYFTTQNIYGSYTSGLFTQGPESGGTVFSIGSSGGASHQASDDFKWGVAPLPGTKKADGTIDKSVISQGPSLVMFDAASNTEEKGLMTWIFTKYLEDPEFQATFSRASGYNPSRQSTYEVEEYIDFLADKTDIAAVTAKVATTMTDDFFTSPAFTGSSTARDQIGYALRYVVQGKKTGAEALADAKKLCGE